MAMENDRRPRAVDGHSLWTRFIGYLGEVRNLDETLHITGGYSYNRFHDYRMQT